MIAFINPHECYLSSAEKSAFKFVNRMRFFVGMHNGLDPAIASIPSHK